ncbi:GNAT family N-acetyltransferase [Parendozoicomonas haliclonae]|uniref:Putative acetyltransferase n=1 Tax=Parendozoicomonas haliclonae TaxID=1960125 RepID=A0A1X7AFB6_9GAMM|nr:GNAT family N-acetyltransferase [Parendozoicomonas haliclonae]SMA34745.1 putative acetyltransferase [Parendozoicomonas haliclonae]
MKIRRIKSADKESFIKLWDTIYAEGCYLQKPPPSDDIIERVIHKVEERTLPNFVAVDNHRVVANVEVFPGSMSGIEREHADQIGILGIQIHQNYREQGLGRKLMRMALDDSRRHGFKEIELHVFSSNQRAINLYQSLGFIYQHDSGEEQLPNGEKVISQCMRLSL